MRPTDLGAFSRRTALAEGMSDAHLRSPLLAQPFHGVRTRVAPVTHEERARAYLPRLRRGQYFSHLTAAGIWGVPLPSRSVLDDPLHVSVPAPHRPPRTRGVVGHVLRPDWTRVLVRRGLPVTDPATTWILLAGVLPPRDLLAAADHLLFTPRFASREDPRPYATIAELEQRLEEYSGRGKVLLRRTLRLASAASASRRETWLRSMAVEAGLPPAQANVEILHEGRLIAIGDLCFERYKVLADYDGSHHQSDDVQYARDRERSLDLQLAGWIQVVVRAEGLGRGRARTIAELKAALRAHGWQG